MFSTNQTVKMNDLNEVISMSKQRLTFNIFMKVSLFELPWTENVLNFFSEINVFYFYLLQKDPHQIHKYSRASPSHPIKVIQTCFDLS